MSLDILKKLKAKKELKIFEFDLVKQLDSKLKFAIKLPDASTHVDHSRQTMESIGLIVPVFRVETLLPISYKHERTGQVYPSYQTG